MKLRIGLIQMRCEKAALAENLAVTSHYFAEAVEKGVDIICFPEMSISGYADPTRYPEAVIQLDGPEVAHILDMTEGIPATVLAGLIEENPEGKPFITQIVVRNGQLLGYYRKITIKDEEEDWFSPGEAVPVFTHKDTIFGIAICADICNEGVFSECARKGAQIVFESAAPGLHGEQETRNWQTGFEWWKNKCKKHLSQYTKKYNMWAVVATQAGRTADEDFPGGGYVFAPDGCRVCATSDWSPGALYVEINLENRHVLPL